MVGFRFGGIPFSGIERNGYFAVGPFGGSERNRERRMERASAKLILI